MPAATPRFRLTFLGATATVTGSRYLLEAGDARVLVDCGLFQGWKPLRLRNWAPFPVDPADIDAVLLTHAHLDHSGYLPRLVREGFRGRIWCTPPTAALCAILLRDSAHLLAEEAEYAARKGSSKHHPPLPLYTDADVRRTLELLRPVAFGEDFLPVPGVHARLRRQGHILGAAAVRVEHAGRAVVFSGDVGRPEDPLMHTPAPPDDADWIVCESTYGDRRHPQDTLRAELLAALRPVLARGGVAVVPAFALGRAQLLLSTIAEMIHDGELAKVPLYLNSPMANDVGELYERFRGEHRLSPAALRRMQDATREVNSAEESKALNRRHGPMVIVSASGMLTGGRVLHHVIAFADDPRNAIVLSGFQAGGTRGAALAAGATSLRIYGQDVRVRAQVIQLLAGSAHADSDELLAWLRSAPRPPRAVFLSHGEPAAADALRLRIEHELHWPAIAPEMRDGFDLLADA